jgi:hypothetical protein
VPFGSIELNSDVVVSRNPIILKLVDGYVVAEAHAESPPFNETS